MSSNSLRLNFLNNKMHRSHLWCKAHILIKKEYLNKMNCLKVSVKVTLNDVVKSYTFIMQKSMSRLSGNIPVEVV